jgi:hypothetical protein
MRPQQDEDDEQRGENQQAELLRARDHRGDSL